MPEYTGEIIPIQGGSKEYTGEIIPIQGGSKKYTAEDIPGSIPQAVPKPFSLGEKATGVAEAGMGTVFGLPAELIGGAVGMIPGGEKAGQAIAQSIQPKSQAGKEYSENISDWMRESGAAGMMPGMGVEASLLEAAGKGTPLRMPRVTIPGAGKVKDTLKYLSDKPATKAAEQLQTGLLGEIGGFKTDLDKLAEQLAKDSKTAIESQKTLSEAKGMEATQKVHNARIVADGQVKQHTALLGENVSAENLGRDIQENGKMNLESARKLRDQKAIAEIKTPVLNNAKARTARGDIPTSNPKSKVHIDNAIKDVERFIEETPELKGQQAKYIQLLEALKKPMNLHQLDYLEAWTKSPLETAKFGFGTDDAYNLKAVSKNVRKAMTEYEPLLTEYYKEYAAGMEEMETILGGKGEVLFTDKPQNVVNHYLDGTKASADKLVRLVGGDKAPLTKSVLGYVRSEVEGKTAAQVEKFITDNKGMLEVFPEAKEPLNKLAKSKAAQERIQQTLEKTPTKIAERTKAQTKGVGATEAAESAKRAGLAAKYENEMSVFKRVSDPKKAATDARGIAKKMLDDGLLNDTSYGELVGKIDAVDKLFGKTVEAKKTMAWLFGGVVGVGSLYKGGQKLGAIP